MRLIRLPRGPTLTFRVKEYTLMRDVVRSQARPKTIGKQFASAPLLVLNGFDLEDATGKLMTTVFQNMFPSIDVSTVALPTIRRVILITYDKETKVCTSRPLLATRSIPRCACIDRAARPPRCCLLAGSCRCGLAGIAAVSSSAHVAAAAPVD